MGDPRASLASQRLWQWFALAALLPAIALVWLGFTVVSRDRASEHQRRQTERGRAADAGVTALARTVASFQQQLDAFTAAPAIADSATLPDAVFIEFSPTGVTSRAGIRLPYYPVGPEYKSNLIQAFAEADAREFSRGDTASAIDLVQKHTDSDRPEIQAGAWLRLGRLYRKAGDRDRALEAFGKLAALEEQLVDGLPAGYVGSAARALILADIERTDTLRREAEGFRHRLVNGAWMLTPAQYTHAMQQVEGWLGAASPPLADDVAALCVALDEVWRDFREQPADSGKAIRPRAVGRGRQSVLILTVAGSQRMTAMLVGAATLDAAWRRNRALTGMPTTTDFVVTDPNEEPVAAGSNERAAASTIRTSAVTTLPWNVTALHRGEPSDIPLSITGRLLIAGIGLMFVVVLAGVFAINRAVAREMRVVRLQSEFVDAVSHEFRSPLTTIRQLSELLASDRVASDDRRHQFYATILSESQRMNRMVENLLDFAKLESGRLSYRRDPIDVRALIGDVTTDVGQSSAASAFQFELDAEANLPQVLGDRDALAHVFRNLLDNAVKYSRDSRTVWVRIRSHARDVAVQVKDAGLGIPKQEQHDIFQKFVRGADATAARISGTGVGLALARQIVEAHGGTIDVESSPGQGSTFTVTLPGLTA